MAGQDQSQLLRRFKQVNIVLDPTGQMKTQSTSAPNWYASVPSLFSQRREGNRATFFTTGVALYEEIANAIDNAREHVWIAGWQVAWDVELEQFGSGKRRLIDLLIAASARKLDIRVMMFGTFMGKPPIDDAPVAQALRDAGIKAIRTSGQSAYKEALYSFFAHHQKTVIVDRQTAFVGGMDLSHGRRDDGDFAARADPSTRRLNEQYNNCVPHGRSLDKEETRLAHLAPSHALAARGPYDGTGKLLDYHVQPRQPWQDVHLRIDGPSTFDVACNFVRRWNGLVEDDNAVKIVSTEDDKFDKFDSPRRPPVTPLDYYITRIGKSTLSEYAAEPLSAGVDGQQTIQILRSASPKELAREYGNSKTPVNLLTELTPAQRAAKVRTPPGEPQVNIQDAMVRAILGAQHFVYIENQYFVSHFGQALAVDAEGNAALMSQAPPSPELAKAWNDTSRLEKVAMASCTAEATDVHNEIVQALGQRIRAAVLMDQPFHVYLMTPLHSEGLLNDPMVMGVMHLTMQTLTFGSESLINLVKRAILEKELGREVVSEMDFDERNLQIWNVEPQRWQKYLTLLYGRTYDLLPSCSLVTEQVYVHSKCLIADDRVAIIGSANINDRSLMGDRDTEIAALVVDTEKSDEMIDGKNSHQVRNFARNLRVALWKKHLGLSKKSDAGPPPATSLAGVLDQPAAPETIAAIQKLAAANSELYEKSFAWVPRNKDDRRLGQNLQPVTMGSSVWPGWRAPGVSDREQPWSKDFEYLTGMFAEVTKDQLDEEIRGFWCAYPYLWMQGQNNLPSAVPLELLSDSDSKAAMPNVV